MDFSKGALGCLGVVGALVFCAPAWAEDPDLTTEASIHVLFSDYHNEANNLVLYDVSRHTFALSNYLVPSTDEAYPSTLVTVALDGHALDRDLRFRFQAGSGEARMQAFPSTTNVCLTPLAGTGTTIPNGTGCKPIDGRKVVSLQTTANSAPALSLDGNPAGQEASGTWLIEEAFASLSLGRARFARLTAGRRRTTIADGLVHDDWATGVDADFDVGAIGPPFEFDVEALDPSRYWPTSGEAFSPMFLVRAEWLPSLFDSVGLFAAGERDRSGSVAETLRGQNVEKLVSNLDRAIADPTGATESEAGSRLASLLAAPYESDATLIWFGTSGGISPSRNQRLSWTAAELLGQINSIKDSLGPIQQDITLQGQAAHVRYSVTLPRLTLATTFLYMSGGNLPQSQTGAGTGTYRGFLGIAPFITDAHLFFGGGLSETFSADRVAAPGVNGCGVIAPAATVTFTPIDPLALEGGFAWLEAPVAGPYGGRTYGPELDLAATVFPTHSLYAGLEWDTLWPGNFYGGTATMYKMVLSMGLRTP